MNRDEALSQAKRMVENARKHQNICESTAMGYAVVTERGSVIAKGLATQQSRLAQEWRTEADTVQFLLDENERLHKELALANARANRFAELINRNDE